MLRTGIASSAYFSYKNGEIIGLKRAKEHGYDCLDYRDFTSAESRLLNEDMAEYERYLSWLKGEADKVGIVFHQAHGLWWMDEKDLEERKSNIAFYKKQIIGCSILGCPNLVIHPCYPGGWSWGSRPENPQTTIEGNLAVIEAILPTAKEYGVTICLENMPFDHYSLSDIRALKELVRMVNDEHVKICFDTGHSCCRQEDICESIKIIGDDLACLHVHDDKKRQDNHLFPYLGDVDWSAFIKGLREIQFKGVISLETEIPEKMPEPMREVMEKALSGIARYISMQVDN